MPVLAFLLARLSEPSSYAGLGAILALTGLHFSDTELGQIAQFLAAGCGLAALLLRERGLIPALLLCLLFGGALGACAPLARETTGIGTTVQTACAAYQKARSAAQVAIATGLVPPDAVSKLAAIEQYGDAACADPPQGDAASTAVWLGGLVGQMAALTDPLLPQQQVELQP